MPSTPVTSTSVTVATATASCTIPESDVSVAASRIVLRRIGNAAPPRLAYGPCSAGASSCRVTSRASSSARRRSGVRSPRASPAGSGTGPTGAVEAVFEGELRRRRPARRLRAGRPAGRARGLGRRRGGGAGGAGRLRDSLNRDEHVTHAKHVGRHPSRNEAVQTTSWSDQVARPGRTCSIQRVRSTNALLPPDRARRHGRGDRDREIRRATRQAGAIPQRAAGPRRRHRPDRLRRRASASRATLDRYSHSIVAGGFELMSSATRLTPGISLMIRLEIVSSRS